MMIEKIREQALLYKSDMWRIARIDFGIENTPENTERIRYCMSDSLRDFVLKTKYGQKDGLGIEVKIEEQIISSCLGLLDKIDRETCEEKMLRCLVKIAHFTGMLALCKKVNIDDALKAYVSTLGKKAADIRHSQPGGSREKQDTIRALWASGRYSSRDICAEQESAALDMSFSTARKALRGTPDPA